MYVYTCISIGFREATEGDACYIADEILKGRFSSAADIFSLGISLLELACDLELPTGGESWHMLRRGCLPRRFTEGTIVIPSDAL